MNSRKIVILGTGGTIAGVADDASDTLAYKAGIIAVEQLLAGIPALVPAPDLLVEQVAQIDSKDMNFDVWAQLAGRVSHYLLRDDVQAIVITHGTDTLEETAFFLQRVLNPSKPVVLTCAMRPATSPESDGPRNILDAIAVARSADAGGVLVVCAGVVHSALHVQKVHTYSLDAFASGDEGPLGHVREGVPVWMGNRPLAQVELAYPAMKNIALTVLDGTWPKVDIVMSYAGASGAVVDALLKSGVQGLVVAGTGNGSIHEALEAALLRAQSTGIPVIRATRCVEGSVRPVAGDGFGHSSGLSPVKARIDLMLRLMALAE